MLVENKFIPIGKVIKMNYFDMNNNQQTTLVTRRSGKKIITKKICIHNNGNLLSFPIGERNWLLNPLNNRVASWHECINEYGSIIAIPWGEEAYHANTYKGNNESYSIEVCERNFNLVYPKAVKRVAELLFLNKWDVSEVTTHKAYSGKNCPSMLLPIWDSFISDIKIELDKLKEVKIMYETSTWAIEAQKWNMDNGISSGDYPKNLVTREEIWVMNKRVYELAKKDAIDEIVRRIKDED